MVHARSGRKAQHAQGTKKGHAGNRKRFVAVQVEELLFVFVFKAITVYKAFIMRWLTRRQQIKGTFSPMLFLCPFAKKERGILYLLRVEHSDLNFCSCDILRENVLTIFMFNS